MSMAVAPSASTSRYKQQRVRVYVDTMMHHRLRIGRPRQRRAAELELADLERGSDRLPATDGAVKALCEGPRPLIGDRGIHTDSNVDAIGHCKRSIRTPTRVVDDD